MGLVGRGELLGTLDLPSSCCNAGAVLERDIGRESPADVATRITTNQDAIGVRQSSEPEVPETSWVQTILR